MAAGRCTREGRRPDFPGDALGKALPYGIYDLAADSGWVNVGTDHDTATFAVGSIRRWWNGQGRLDYSQARHLLITAGAGGSNGYRTRAFKTELAVFAAESGLTVTVCHMPPGTSKWNKVEHRLFSAITMNWRGRPLNSHEVVVQSIAATTTRTGLTVHAELDTGAYPTGVKVSDAELNAVPVTGHAFPSTANGTTPCTPRQLPGRPHRTHAWADGGLRPRCSVTSRADRYDLHRTVRADRDPDRRLADAAETGPRRPTRRR